MAKPVNVLILERARALITDERHWCPGDMARDRFGYAVDPIDSAAEQRCALGALVAAAYQLSGDRSAARALAMTALRPLVGATALTRINDTQGHAAVLALFDEVLAGL